MPTDQKATLVAEIKQRFAEAPAVILADYRGLSVKEMQALRTVLRTAGGDVKIYKNTLTEIALRELSLPTMDEYLVGPTAFVFIGEDPVGPAKALVDFAKEHKALELKGALMARSVIAADRVKALAALPSREELIAKLLGTMQSPLSGVARVLNGPAGAFARVVRAIADQKAAAA